MARQTGLGILNSLLEAGAQVFEGMHDVLDSIAKTSKGG
jgi:hypothetical protein